MPDESNSWMCSCKKQWLSGDGVDRRTFLKTAAVAAGSLGLFAAPAAQARSAEEIRAALEAWTRTLWDKGTRRIYRGEELKHIAMPMGGVGAGQVYLTGKGRLEPWQIVNNFNANAVADGALFAVWARRAGESSQVRLLQQDDVGDIPGMPEVTFAGEYPFAWLTFDDPGAPLPLLVSMEAYSPMIPLNAKDSGLPAVVFRFTLKNPSSQPVEAALLATAPNLAGWEGYSTVEKASYPEFIGNVNEVHQDMGATHVFMSSTGGENHRLSALCRVVTDAEDIAWNLRLCGNVAVYHDQWDLPDNSESRAVFWLNTFDESLRPAQFQAVADKVAAGATLILSALDNSPAAMGGNPAAKRRRKGKVFEDWESGNYGFWSIEDAAFGNAPAHGPARGQDTVRATHGARWVNTSYQGDGTTGRARSKAFKIRKPYIHLLVGGGNHPGETCINLVVDGQIVCSAQGRNSDQLSPVRWDVEQYIGKKAHIDIVDKHTGAWGHIIVDDIVFSKSPASPFDTHEFVQSLYKMIPFAWQDSTLLDAQAAIIAGRSLHTALGNRNLTLAGARRFKELVLREGARIVLEAAGGVPLLIKSKHGQGTVVFCNGDPTQWAQAIDKKTVLGAILALAIEADYQPQTGLPADSPHFGTMALSALAPDALATAQWDDLAALWYMFSRDGRIAPSETGPSAPGRTWNAAVVTPMTLQPGESRDVRFVLAWHFPNRTRVQRYGWGPGPFQYDHRLGNQYNTHFGDALEVSRYVASGIDRLEKETRLFHDTFYDSTLPRWLLDCVSANASTTRSPIYVWLEDGTIGGFEGSDSCCPMNCTHVYNYAMSMAYLFPDLERNVRETDLLYQMHPELHFIPHRTVLPLSLPRLGNEIGGPHHHALDGELGTILKLCREWRMCGDRAWLAKLWPNAKKVMQHVLKDHDVNGDGVIKGEQPNTYDTHLFGSNTFVGSLYLAALRATEEMARLMDDPDFAEECRRRFEMGRDGYDRICWDGEYFCNVYDAPNVTPQQYNDNNCFGPGCHADQLLGQWWANVLGLGYVLPPDHVKQALQSIYRYCWRADLTDHVQTQRTFASGTEMGLLNCSWPKGGRPERPILYRDEVWTGIEYHVAATMLYEGMVQEAFQIIKGARDRYTGNQRNPWSEIECGGHYARAMSSWSLLHAAAGFLYNAGTKSLAINPRVTPDEFKAFFTTGAAWGTLSVSRKNGRYTVTVDTRYGELAVKSLTLPSSAISAATADITVSGQGRCSAQKAGKSVTVTFVKDYRIAPGKPLIAKYPA